MVFVSLLLEVNLPRRTAVDIFPNVPPAVFDEGLGHV